MTPTIYIILGITGDLATKKILPALYSMYIKRQLPKNFAIVGFSRRDFSDYDIRQFISDFLPHTPRVKKFLKHLTYIQGGFGDIKTYTNLGKHLEGIDGVWGQCSNKLFYVSVPPTLYENIFVGIARSGLSIPCGGDLGWSRVLIEKPFGYDYVSSRRLNRLAEKLFKSSQIYRIDHYMAKTSLREIEDTRRSDKLFSKQWNAQHIQQVDINLLEKNTVEKRGAFYDLVGTVNDVGQNHMLQMLALVASPLSKKVSVKKSHRDRAILFSTLSISSKDAVRAQYNGFRNHDQVAQNSQTETFFSLHVSPTVGPLKKVPVTLTSGKGLSEDRTEVIVHLTNGNIMTFSSPRSESMLAYERVLYDAMVGDQTVFTSGEEVEAQWKFAIRAKKVLAKTKLKFYKIGTSEKKI